MISIIIPAFNEQETIGDLVQFLRANSSIETEILVVDGGSTDNTINEAEQVGAKVIISPKKGRARQMNYGASQARFEVLYFLHADTYPPETYTNDIQIALNAGFDSGCFRLRFDDNHPALKFYSWFTKFDLNLFRFGDQSLFIKKDIFEIAGKFDESLIVMEDQEIIHAIKKVSKFKIINKEVTTSARKYMQVGVVKLQLIFTFIVIMYYIGIDQQKIVDFYIRKIT